MADHRCTSCGADVASANSLCSACRQRDRLVTLGRQVSASISQIGGLVPNPAPAGAAPGAINQLQIGGSLTGNATTVTSTPAAEPAAETAPRQRRIRKPRYFIPLALLLLATMIVGFYGFRIRETLNTINSVSTVAPSLSGDALGGSANVSIDAGPAMTAMAGGFIGTPTATLEPSATSIPPTSTPTVAPPASTTEPTAKPTSTPEPTQPKLPSPPAGSANNTVAAAQTDDEEPTGEPVATETAEPVIETATSAPTQTTEPSPTTQPSATTEPSSTPEATSTSEPTVEPGLTLSEIERVKNGDFEAGAVDWWTEQGAAVTVGDSRSGVTALTIDATGGFAAQRIFFVPETTYYVSMWVKLSTDSAEDAEVGLNFMDASDARLTALEPAITKVNSERWTEVTYEFTAPAEAAAVQVYVWKPSGRATLFVDDVSIRSVVPPESLNMEIQASADGSMTILLMGVDARDGEAIDIGVRPDSLMVLHLNKDTGSCRVLSIPRDTRTDLPGYGLTKVNHALAVGGIEYQIQVVQKMLGLNIDNYMLIDFNGFQDLVDAVGGITVDVPADFSSSDGQIFYAGAQQMSGKQALSYARYRGGSDGDFGRQERQQQILRALVQRASGLNVVTSINELLPAVEQNLRTDLSASEMTSLATDYRASCTQETISMLRLEGSTATYPDPMLQMNLSYVEVDAAEIRRKVIGLLEP